jgi:tetratricopeptide (TPR) repeat protein
MTARHLIRSGAVALVLLVAAALAGAFRGSTSAARPAGPPQASAALLQGGFAAGNTQSLVARLEETVRTRPDDAESSALLGLAYQQQARETGDSSYYPRSDAALRRALRLHPGDLVATSGLGALALSRHDFRAALAYGRRALRRSPTTAHTYGVVGDALVELGRYQQAFAAFDTMARLRPSLAAYARVSYARELRGNTHAARAAMELALDAAAGQAEPLAWTHVQLGKLAWVTGDGRTAEREYRLALAALPGYVYALDALAQVEGSRGHLRRAIHLEREAIDRTPLPQFVATLSDLYRLAGEPQRARQQAALVDVIRRLLVANGVRTDLETALFQVDHGIRLRQSLALARRAHAERPSIDGEDVLAWALARNGRCAEALPHSRRALRLGTRDALKEFHRGMIERCLGHRAASRVWLGRALALNPHFSLLWSSTARRLLQ